MKKIWRWLSTISLSATCSLGGAEAADFPQRPVKLIVPYAPGGSTDVLGRSLAELMRKDLGQPVVVENRPGGNTGIGAQATVVSLPDGYTVLLGTAATVVLNPMLYPKLAYDPTGLIPVARIALTPLVVVTRQDSPIRNLQDLLTQGKSPSSKLTYASTGIGSSLHLAGEILQSETGMQMLHVPYKGSAPALTGLLGGETSIFIDVVGSSMPLIKGGKLRALAVTSNQRLPALPDVPTVAESGLPKFDVTTWFGLLVPKGTPDAVIARINASVTKATADKAFREQFEGLGLIVPPPMGVKEFNDYVGAEVGKWSPIIKAKNITLE